MSVAFFTIFPYTWGHVSFQFLLVFGSLLCTFLLLLASVCFPGIHLNLGINASLNFPEEYPHTKALVGNVEFTSDILGDIKKNPLEQFCFLKLSLLLLLPQVLVSHPPPQHRYAFPILLSSMLRLRSSLPSTISHSSSIVQNSLPLF